MLECFPCTKAVQCVAAEGQTWGFPQRCVPHRGAMSVSICAGLQGLTSMPAVPTARLRIPLICTELVPFLITQGWMDGASALRAVGHSHGPDTCAP